MIHSPAFQSKKTFVYDNCISLILLHKKSIYYICTVIFVQVLDKKFSTQQQQPELQEIETILKENCGNDGKYI